MSLRKWLLRVFCKNSRGETEIRVNHGVAFPFSSSKPQLFNSSSSIQNVYRLASTGFKKSFKVCDTHQGTLANLELGNLARRYQIVDGRFAQAEFLGCFFDGQIISHPRILP